MYIKCKIFRRSHIPILLMKLYISLFIFYNHHQLLNEREDPYNPIHLHKNIYYLFISIYNMSLINSILNKLSKFNNHYIILLIYIYYRQKCITKKINHIFLINNFHNSQTLYIFLNKMHNFYLLYNLPHQIKHNML